MVMLAASEFLHRQEFPFTTSLSPSSPKHDYAADLSTWIDISKCLLHAEHPLPLWDQLHGADQVPAGDRMGCYLNFDYLTAAARAASIILTCLAKLCFRTSSTSALLSFRFPSSRVEANLSISDQVLRCLASGTGAA